MVSPNCFENITFRVLMAFCLSSINFSNMASIPLLRWYATLARGMPALRERYAAERCAFTP